MTTAQRNDDKLFASLLEARRRGAFEASRVASTERYGHLIGELNTQICVDDSVYEDTNLTHMKSRQAAVMYYFDKRMGPGQIK